MALAFTGFVRDNPEVVRGILEAHMHDFDDFGGLYNMNTPSNANANDVSDQNDKRSKSPSNGSGSPADGAERKKRFSQKRKEALRR